jgi:hypothetical protein
MQDVQEKKLKNHFFPQSWVAAHTQHIFFVQIA